MCPFVHQTNAKRFIFDTVFDGETVTVAPRPKRTFTPEDMEAVRAEAFAAGERSATARAEAEQARALGEIAAAARGALGALTRVAHDHRSDSAALSLAAARKIAGAALDAFPEAPVVAALSALARELEVVPRLVVQVGGGDLARLEASLSAAADQAGFGGQIVVKADAGLARAAFVLDWGDGRASFDPEDASQKVGAALETALLAEGLHAEPLDFSTGVTEA